MLFCNYSVLYDDQPRICAHDRFERHGVGIAENALCGLFVPTHLLRKIIYVFFAGAG